MFAGTSPKPGQDGLSGCSESQKCTFPAEDLKYPDVPSWLVTSDTHQAVLLFIAEQRHEGRASALLCTRWL